MPTHDLLIVLLVLGAFVLFGTVLFSVERIEKRKGRAGAHTSHSAQATSAANDRLGRKAA